MDGADKLSAPYNIAAVCAFYRHPNVTTPTRGFERVLSHLRGNYHPVKKQKKGS